MGINFAAASTAGLNNPGTEIITLVKDESGNFINPPSYDKMRAYLSSGEVPMLFVTAEGGETGSLYQFAEYAETENKIRFNNDTSAIEFCAGCEVPNVYDLSTPKPLTYDYMPEGYPRKSAETVTLMAEQEIAFDAVGGGRYGGVSADGFRGIAVGKTYIVTWDGTDYKCMCYDMDGVPTLGNASIADGGSDTGEPFVYIVPQQGDPVVQIMTLDTSASHTISVKTVEETVTPMAAEFIPDVNSIIMKSCTTDSTKKFKITVNDSGTISATEVT